MLIINPSPYFGVRTILPEKSHLTDHTIKDCHGTQGHADVAETLTQVREKFWILKGRQRVKSNINKCVICYRFKAKPLSQDIAPLPTERITEANPFEVVVLDFAGPMSTKDETGKAYIALYTCAVTRAVHLELVSSQTTNNFLLSFRRFISRRGVCRMIYSDNAKTFKRADEDLQKLWNTIKDTEVQNYLVIKVLRWKFKCGKGGLGGTVSGKLHLLDLKYQVRYLKKILMKASFKFEELETVFIEIEAILNSRLLT
ncbi:uncharacterized protein LOC118183936 [Stegodyphus dumicola]|uniref:uncharacterized protein LOC118183936 n=1 Tax=Stegodyphus dumicola TaxID=202533 RepID=UPI0015A87E21|nr:uncharacterized protein LOC118183936 [Stegodyphus dumicola]